MKVEVIEKADKSDPLIGSHEVHVEDGSKKYVYRSERSDNHQKNLNEAVGKAIEDLVYHDGVKGRVRE